MKSLGAATQVDAAERFRREMAPSPGPSCTIPNAKAASLRDLFDYWKSLPAVRGIPDAADFRPTAIARWLPDATIMEICSPDMAIYRLAGTRVAERMGHDPTGVNVLDIVADGYRRQAARDLHEIVYRPCGLLLRYVNTYSSGRMATIESLYLPLRPPAGSNPRVIAVHAPETTLQYTEPMKTSSIADAVQCAIWIDIGQGTPRDVQRP